MPPAAACVDASMSSSSGAGSQRDTRTTRTGHPHGPATARGPPPCARRGRPRRDLARRNTPTRRARPATPGPCAPTKPSSARVRPTLPPTTLPTHSAAADTSSTPQGVVPRDPGVHPELRPGLEIDRPSPAAATGQVDVPLAAGRARRPTPRLRAAEHQRGPVTSRASATRRGSGRNCSTSKGDGGGVNLRRRQRDTAPTTGRRQRDGATATGARRAGRASPAASTPTRRATDRP